MPREFPLIGNITNSLRILHKHSLARITSTIYEVGKNPASKDKIIDWSISESKILDPKVVWLLTYAASPTNFVMEERELLLNKLKKANIRYIDTFEYLFGNLNNDYMKKDLWFGHHTALGNNVVCRAIIESKIYEFSK